MTRIVVKPIDVQTMLGVGEMAVKTHLRKIHHHFKKQPTDVNLQRKVEFHEDWQVERFPQLIVQAKRTQTLYIFSHLRQKILTKYQFSLTLKINNFYK